MAELHGKVVFITGAAGGQGAEHARVLSRLGAKVVLSDLDEAAVSIVAGEIEGETLAVALDVRSEPAWDDAFARRPRSRRWSPSWPVTRAATAPVRSSWSTAACPPDQAPPFLSAMLRASIPARESRPTSALWAWAA
jgi:NAD(P)-dependent dehydrogenase (short-subunit alcohol dehydrogenase family)